MTPLEDYLEILACPECASALALDRGGPPGGNEEDSALRCTGCGAGFAVVEGIPRLMPHGPPGRYQGYFERKAESDSLAAMDYHSEASFETRRAWLDRVLSEIPAGWIVDVGCGSGRMTGPWAAQRPVLGIDSSPSMLRWARSRGLLVATGSAERLPVRRRAAACVIALEVVQYMDTPSILLNEITRITLPGGHLCLSWLPDSLPRLLRRRLLGGHEGSPRLHPIDGMLKSLVALGWTGIELSSGFWPFPGTHQGETAARLARDWAAVAFVQAVAPVPVP